LTSRGRSTLKQIAPVWVAIRDCTEELITDSGQDLLRALTAMEVSLHAKPMGERLRVRLKSDRAVEILQYRPALRNSFESLNLEWLGRVVPLEENDRRMLHDPESAIIQEGGQVLFARVSRTIAGTVAVIRQKPGVYEIAKMAVTEKHRGKGIGRQLSLAAIAWAQNAGATEIRIATSPKLKPALALYQSLGFQETTPDAAWRSEYRRKTIFLILNRSKKSLQTMER
jgi:GNAT superfamily N-acetyltransferase